MVTSSASTAAMRMAIAIVPKVVGLSSLTGSLYIMYSLMGSTIARKEKMTSTFHRFLVCLSLYDAVSSFGFFFSTWAAPRDPPEGMENVTLPSHMEYDYLFPLAAGNRATCSAQGFAIYTGLLGSGLFTGFISLQYVLKVRYMWMEESMRRLEKVCFTLGILYPIASGLYLLATQQFNLNNTGWCWVTEYPYICSDNYYGKEPHLEPWCNDYPALVSERSTNIIQAFLFSIAMVLVIFTVAISMVLLYITVRRQEQRSAQWSEASREGRYQKKVVQKAMLYIGSFLLIYLPTTALAMGRASNPDYEDLIMNILWPIQGVFNAMVYSNTAERLLCRACCIQLHPKHERPPTSARPFSSTSMPDQRSSMGPCEKSPIGAVDIEAPCPTMSNADHESYPPEGPPAMATVTEDPCREEQAPNAPLDLEA